MPVRGATLFFHPIPANEKRTTVRPAPFTPVSESNRHTALQRRQALDLKLTGKTAFVTGSTAGIGFAIAHALAREGAYVWVNGRTQARVDAAIASIKSDLP
ncbi:MAG: SDR family NAD(P)-dependent oxidoreductase, partial [Terracidiphilus sp.]